MMELANQHLWDGMERCMHFLAEQKATTRIMGSSALSIAQVAAGNATAAVMSGSNRIDVGAGVLLAREAGYIVRGRDHDEYGFPKDGLLVAHADTVDSLYSVVFK